MQYAPVWKRLLAAAFDIVLIAAMSVLVLSVSGYETFVPGQKRFTGPALIVTLAISILYSVGFMGRFQATPGMIRLGLRVVKPGKDKLSYADAALRFCVFIFPRAVAYYEDFMPLSTALIVQVFTLHAVWFLPMVFTKQRTAVYDLVCKTRVIGTEKAAAPLNSPKGKKIRKSRK